MCSSVADFCIHIVHTEIILMVQMGLHIANMEIIFMVQMGLHIANMVIHGMEIKNKCHQLK